MPVTISLDSALVRRTNKNNIEVNASSVEEAIKELNILYPGFESDILDSENGGVRESLQIFVNGTEILDDLNTPIPDGSTIDIVRLMVGG